MARRLRFHNILGFLLAGRGDPGAVPAYREAIRLCPGRAETHASFGRVLLEEAASPVHVDDPQTGVKGEGFTVRRLALGGR